VLPIYATALAVGGTLLLASLVLGHHGADHGGDAGGGHDHGGDHGAHEGELGLLATFMSIRFWTFTLAFFGLTGVVFEEMQLLKDGRAILGLSSVLGGGIGFAAATLVRYLRAHSVSSVPTEIGYVGLTGEVLLDVTPEEPGRIRISARGSLIDLPAKTQGPALKKGASALVVDMTDGVARVAAPSEEKR
jgi:hypothetical protein